MLDKRVVALGFVGLLAWTVFAQDSSSPRAQEPAPLPVARSDDSTVLMRAKLSSSQKVIEGLMAGDFAMIRKGGEDLQKICDSTQWRQGDNQVIVHYRAELRRSAIKLIKQADEQNLDGAAYTYMHSMTTCINCHQYSRDVLRVALREEPRVVPIPVTEPESNSQRARAIYR